MSLFACVHLHHLFSFSLNHQPGSARGFLPFHCGLFRRLGAPVMGPVTVLVGTDAVAAAVYVRVFSCSNNGVIVCKKQYIYSFAYSYYASQQPQPPQNNK